MLKKQTFLFPQPTQDGFALAVCTHKSTLFCFFYYFYSCSKLFLWLFETFVKSHRISFVPVCGLLVRNLLYYVTLCTRSVLQALHGCCERAVRGAVIPGCGLEWAQHYRCYVESDQHCLNEWRAMTGLESVRKDKGARSSCNRESVEREIKVQLRDIMRTEDLENITSKQVKIK